MKYNIQDTKGEVLFTAEIECHAYTVDSRRKRLAVLWAIENGKSLKGADLRYANLSEADLSGTDFSGTDLKGADLSGANLRDANLQGANFQDADLLSAKVTGKQLGEAIFNGDAA